MEECASLIKAVVVDDHANKAEAKAAMLSKLLSPYLDTWDANTMQEAEDSEVVGLFDDANHVIASNDSSIDNGQDVSLPRSETAADACLPIATGAKPMSSVIVGPGTSKS